MDKTILLRLSDISTSYDGKTVFSGVTLDVHAHDFIGIVGPNGGGKTTLVKVMLGLKEVDNGMVERYRNGVVDPSVTIGYLPQYNHIVMWCSQDLAHRNGCSPISLLNTRHRSMMLCNVLILCRLQTVT